ECKNSNLKELIQLYNSPAPRGGINSLKKIKIVYQSGKCPFYNSLRIINYLIPPLEGARGRF
ncbi:hypothetical protein, partial [Capnocytophaga granulosa]